MRDPDRIPEFLKVVQSQWEKVPDWRFGQLLENLKRFIGMQDIFYMEDDDFLAAMIEFFKPNQDY
jgi:uncharacterized protein YihD (DUF1040 family)